MRGVCHVSQSVGGGNLPVGEARLKKKKQQKKKKKNKKKKTKGESFLKKGLEMMSAILFFCSDIHSLCQSRNVMNGDCCMCVSGRPCQTNKHRIVLRHFSPCIHS